MTQRALYLSFCIAASALIAAQACGPTKQPCGPANCIGCCTAAGNCEVGVAITACGQNGATCTTCLGGQLCQLGACKYPNGGGGGAGGGSGGGTGGGASCAASCAGCCLGNTCSAGTSTSSCGYGGAACVGCTGNQTCQSGFCVDQSCNGCVSGSTCVTAPDDSHCGSFGLTCLDCTVNGGTCNTGSGACTGGTCGGCRDQQGACQPGNTKGACGVSGNSCQSCSGTDVCSGGTCVGGTGGGSGGGVGGGTGGGGVGGGVGGGGGGSSDPCTVASNCVNDPAPTVDSIASCHNSLNDVTCGSYFQSAILCLEANQVCASDGTTDQAATQANCSSQLNAYVSCSQGTGGGAGGGGGIGGGVGGGGGIGGGVGGGGGIGGGAGGGGGSSPQGDTCATAIPLSFFGGSASVTGDNTNFTNDYTDPGNATACNTGGQDIVYSFTTTTTQTFTATATATGTSPNLYPALYLRNTPCSSWTTGTSSLACIGGGLPTGTTTVVTFPATSLSPGTYYLVLDCDDVQYPGPFTLTATLQ